MSALWLALYSLQSSDEHIKFSAEAVGTRMPYSELMDRSNVV
jgi:hypothetical protein